jgi:hypothetical protein
LATVAAGGTANNTTIDSGGTAIFASATADGITVKDGGPPLTSPA